MTGSSFVSRIGAALCVADGIAAARSTLLPWLVVSFHRPGAPPLVETVDLWHLDLYNGPFWRQVSPLWVAAGAIALIAVAVLLVVGRRRRHAPSVVALAAIATGCLTYGALRPTILGGSLGIGATEARGDGFWLCVVTAVVAGVVMLGVLGRGLRNASSKRPDRR